MSLNFTLSEDMKVNSDYIEVTYGNELFIEKHVEDA